MGCPDAGSNDVFSRDESDAAVTAGSGATGGAGGAAGASGDPLGGFDNGSGGPLDAGTVDASEEVVDAGAGQCGVTSFDAQQTVVKTTVPAEMDVTTTIIVARFVIF